MTAHLLLALLLALPAHPLGRGSLNQALVVEPTPPLFRFVYTLDLAETATAREMLRMDTDLDGAVGPAEDQAWFESMLPLALEGLVLTVNGARVPLEATGHVLRFFRGEEGFPTALLEVHLVGRAGAALRAGANRVEVEDRAFPQAPGRVRVRAAVPVEWAARCWPGRPAWSASNRCWRATHPA